MQLLAEQATAACAPGGSKEQPPVGVPAIRREAHTHPRSSSPFGKEPSSAGQLESLSTSNASNFLWMVWTTILAFCS